MIARVLVAVAALALVACNDFSEPWQLDRARVLAVRSDAPGLAAEARGAIDVLVADASGAPSVVAPAQVAAVQGATTAVAVARDGAGWIVTAGDAEALAAARTEAGLEPDDPLTVTIGVAVIVDGVELAAIKQLRLGESLANPVTPTIAVDGVVPTGAATVGPGRDIALTVDVAAAEELEFDWLTSTGELRRNETPTATLSLAADDPTAGHVVAIIRSDLGGVSWASVELTGP